jgi:hypothetical protein
VRPTLQVDGESLPNVFACGDVADTGIRNPNGRSAFKQAMIVADNIGLAIDGKQPDVAYEPHWADAIIKLTLGLVSLLAGCCGGRRINGREDTAANTRIVISRKNQSPTSRTKRPSSCGIPKRRTSPSESPVLGSSWVLLRSTIPPIIWPSTDSRHRWLPVLCAVSSHGGECGPRRALFRNVVAEGEHRIVL